MCCGHAHAQTARVRTAGVEVVVFDLFCEVVSYRSRQKNSFSQISTASKNGYELHTFGYLRSGSTGPGLRKINVIRCAPNSRHRSNASWPAHACALLAVRLGGLLVAAAAVLGCVLAAVQPAALLQQLGRAGAGIVRFLPGHSRSPGLTWTDSGHFFSSRSLLDDCFKRQVC